MYAQIKPFHSEYPRLLLCHIRSFDSLTVAQDDTKDERVLINSIVGVIVSK